MSTIVQPNHEFLQPPVAVRQQAAPAAACLVSHETPESRSLRIELNGKPGVYKNTDGFTSCVFMKLHLRNTFYGCWCVLVSCLPLPWLCVCPWKIYQCICVHLDPAEFRIFVHSSLLLWASVQGHKRFFPWASKQAWCGKLLVICPPWSWKFGLWKAVVFRPCSREAAGSYAARLAWDHPWETQQCHKKSATAVLLARASLLSKLV